METGPARHAAAKLLSDPGVCTTLIPNFRVAECAGHVEAPETPRLPDGRDSWWCQSPRVCPARHGRRGRATGALPTSRPRKRSSDFVRMFAGQSLLTKACAGSPPLNFERMTYLGLMSFLSARTANRRGRLFGALCTTSAKRGPDPGCCLSSAPARPTAEAARETLFAVHKQRKARPRPRTQQETRPPSEARRRPPLRVRARPAPFDPTVLTRPDPVRAGRAMADEDEMDFSLKKKKVLQRPHAN